MNSKQCASTLDQAREEALEAIYSVYDRDTNFDEIFNAIKIGRTQKGDAAALRKSAEKIYERIMKTANILEKNGIG